MRRARTSLAECIDVLNEALALLYQPGLAENQSFRLDHRPVAMPNYMLDKPGTAPLVFVLNEDGIAVEFDGSDMFGIGAKELQRDRDDVVRTLVRLLTSSLKLDLLDRRKGYKLSLVDPDGERWGRVHYYMGVRDEFDPVHFDAPFPPVSDSDREPRDTAQ
ncbi:MAG: hypothetical protein ACI81L_003295 [Verrucomicrobiales bacterium]|jgi:hypothetical protein